MNENNLNPNAAIESMKEMLNKLSGMGDKFKTLAGSVDEYTIKTKNKFVLNEKEGEISVTKNNFIMISLQNINENDVKEITRRLLSQ